MDSKRQNSLKILSDFINGDKKQITVSGWQFYPNQVLKELKENTVEVVREAYFPRDGAPDFTLIKRG